MSHFEDSSSFCAIYSCSSNCDFDFNAVCNLQIATLCMLIIC